MKKFLLIAAMAAVALGSSAQDYKFEKVWEVNNLTTLLPSTNDVRQGIGMNGYYYVNDKRMTTDEDGNVVLEPTIYEIGENGLTGRTFPGGLNCGISRDEAGNLIVSTASFPGVWGATAGLKVINPETGEVKDYIIPEEAAVQGRCDFIGTAKGDMMEDGEIFIVGATQGTQISRIAIAGGEIDYDNSYLMNCDGVSATTSTVLNYYVDANGEDAVLYVTRNAPLKKMTFDGDNFAAANISLPGKGACNGTFPFVFDGKELFAYPTLPNYLDGFAIAENNAEAAMFDVAPTVAANGTAFQGNWVNAEVNGNEVLIYHYYPGVYLNVYRMSKEQAVVWELGDVNHDKTVDVADVTTLITYVLNGSGEGFFETEADCDGAEGIDVADVTALITFVLNGNW